MQGPSFRTATTNLVLNLQCYRCILQYFNVSSHTLQDQESELRTLRQQATDVDLSMREKADDLNATLSELSMVQKQLHDQEAHYSEQIMIITVSPRISRNKICGRG